MYIIYSRNKIGYITVALFIVTFILYLPTRRITMRLHPTRSLKYGVKFNLNMQIACHSYTEGDALSSIQYGNFSPPDNSIFFHETSCRGGLNSRQACLVEAAAKQHPDKEVYVLFSGPVSETHMTQSPLSAFAALRNVNLARVHLSEYAKGTVLEELVEGHKNHLSNWPVQHTADVLRLITLYKFGGISLDTDVLVTKRLDSLGKNWVIAEGNNGLDAAALAVGKDALGRNIIKRLMNDLNINFDTRIWDANGAHILTSVLKDFCNTTKVRHMSEYRCHGLKVLSPTVVYTVPNNYELHINGTPEDFYEFEEARAVHLRNKFTFRVEYFRDSLMDNLMKKNCMSVYRRYKDLLLKSQDVKSNIQNPDKINVK